MDWNAPIDLYCERTDPGLWAEPLNAASNLGFVAVAVTAVVLQRRSGKPDYPILALALVVAAIGVGSFLFHTFANGWSMLADVGPITAFIYLYLALALRRLLKLPWLAAGAALALFLALSFPLEAALRPLIGGSARYAPALAAMLAVGAALALRRHPAGRPVLAAAAIFAVSLTLRTLDAPLCPHVPSGTHFLWHLLNAATLGALLLAPASSAGDDRG